jgi:hypothetical protein
VREGFGDFIDCDFVPESDEEEEKGDSAWSTDQPI